MGVAVVKVDDNQQQSQTLIYVLDEPSFADYYCTVVEVIESMNESANHIVHHRQYESALHNKRTDNQVFITHFQRFIEA